MLNNVEAVSGAELKEFYKNILQMIKTGNRDS